MMKASDSEVAASPVPHIGSKGNKFAKDEILDHNCTLALSGNSRFVCNISIMYYELISL